MTNEEMRAAIEAILFASGEPLEITRIAEAMETDVETVRGYIFEIGASLDSRGSGICLLKLGDKYQLCSRKEYAPLIRAVLDLKKNIPLSNAALEVLAVVAYNQPVTKAYIEQVRGVDCSGVVNTLCQKGLLEERGRLELPGRPLLYGTTPNFLRCFCLTSLADLPELPEKPAEMMISDQDDEIDSTQGEQIRNFFQAELESAETENEE
ncbi:MAG: SMC-Scp complex subunit ScpB [Clostridia bacterium]|nr:SMC-Scp complex subunit ScpB [Clostridia bacterium]MBR4451897.1 SMC-Scp complex subunit ScpB [Clostridia bacterium]